MAGCPICAPPLDLRPGEDEQVPEERGKIGRGRWRRRPRRNHHEPYGNPQGSGNLATGIWTQSTALIDSTLAEAIASRQPLRYAGYFYDSESGLYYLSSRHYDPV